MRAYVDVELTPSVRVHEHEDPQHPDRCTLFIGGASGVPAPLMIQILTYADREQFAERLMLAAEALLSGRMRPLQARSEGMGTERTRPEPARHECRKEATFAPQGPDNDPVNWEAP